MVEDLEKAASYAGSPVEWPTASLKGNKDHSSLVASSSEPRELGKEPATGSALEISIKDADVTLAFMLEHDAKVPPITPDQERALSRKIFLRVFSLTWVVCLVLYTDKATLSYSTIMGLFDKTHLNSQLYNDANTLFYVGFLLGQIPSLLAMQYLPLNRVLFGMIVLWGTLTFLMCAAYNPAGVLILRFALGFVESSAIPLLTTTNGMFMTRNERAASSPLWYAACMASPIPIGFVAYGLLWANSPTVQSMGTYRLLHIIIGGCTFILAVVIWFAYPANPVQAKFLTTEEAVWTIRRVQETQKSTIEQKNTFKWHHALEAVRDPITWFFCLALFCNQLANNLAYMQQLLFTQIGNITNLDSTLVTVAGSGYSVVWAAFASLTMVIFPNTTVICVLWSVLPSLVGSIVAVSLPLSNPIGMLAAISLAGQSFGVAWICMYSLSTTTAGSSFTKRLARQALVLVAYSISNIISPQLWQERDAPRYIPAWIIQIVLSFTVSPAIVAGIGLTLRRRNKQRRGLLDTQGAEGYVLDEEGNKVAVNRAALDVTDLEDPTFIYPT